MAKEPLAALAAVSIGLRLHGDAAPAVVLDLRGNMMYYLSCARKG